MLYRVSTVSLQGVDIIMFVIMLLEKLINNTYYSSSE